VIYLAPCLLGADARPLLEIAPLSALEQRLTLKFTEVTMIGSDLRITGSRLRVGRSVYGIIQDIGRVAGIEAHGEDLACDCGSNLRLERQAIGDA